MLRIQALQPAITFGKKVKKRRVQEPAHVLPNTFENRAKYPGYAVRGNLLIQPAYNGGRIIFSKKREQWMFLPQDQNELRLNREEDKRRRRLERET